MLRREHFLYEYHKGILHPDRLMKGKHGHYLPLTERMLEIYRNGIGETRRDLHRSVEEIYMDVEDCPVRRIRAFCKLLDDASVYDTEESGNSYPLRKRIFEYAAAFHPLVKERNRFFDNIEDDIKKRIIQEQGNDKTFEKIKSHVPDSDWKTLWREIESRLFNDVPEFNRLLEFPGYENAQAFLSRYNIAQIQAALYNATEVIIRATQDFKTILRFAKISGLMHTIRRTITGSYEIRLDGPASLMRETRRYGVALARFLPGLISCRGWRMHARLQTPQGSWASSLELSDKEGLRSPVSQPKEFDSRVEETFFQKWGQEPREGWTIRRETELLHHEQKVFFPDFVFSHEDGRKVYFEIIGFWTQEYLDSKAKALMEFHEAPIILAIQKGLVSRLPELPMPFVTYKNNLKINAVLDAIRKFY
ncbi:DUF790 family protein [Candidatus Sumerlaeota bacterium]|nr:DUF790 family protein [Candidatus Sumerlaeota bacterium]